MKNFQFSGPILISLAAALWALDALIRSQIGNVIPASAIIFIEHVIGFILLLPFARKAFRELRKMNQKDWIVMILIAGFASVLGTFFFTHALALSFGQYDFTTPIFLQKMQPIFAITLAVALLRERLERWFIPLTVLALLGSYLVTFGWGWVGGEATGKGVIYLYSLLAALAW